ncbi:hypothetical protein EVAR_67906_1 [Eumeta japonica]|uniref:Uncharacterized protein n=1 Tax=Eumeta variegata TaxID=151549 RepID=A0A4C1YVH8_EUMVA|nr:hypothetical protein EVAR_67906_1 [Eumeta japonica]
MHFYLSADIYSKKFSLQRIKTSPKNCNNLICINNVIRDGRLRSVTDAFHVAISTSRQIKQQYPNYTLRYENAGSGAHDNFDTLKQYKAPRPDAQTNGFSNDYHHEQRSCGVILL